MNKKGHIPIRTCIGCRKKKKKEEMIWLAQHPGGALVVNGRKPHHGRGYYLCPDIGCLNLAKRKNRGVGFLEKIDFRYLTAKGFFDRGGWE